MTPPTPPPPRSPQLASSIDIPASARRRRTIYSLRSAVMLLAITAVCLFACLIASRAAARIDATVTRQHRLSPRTLDLLKRLESGGTYEVIIAADPRTLEPATWQRTNDVLDALSHASRNVEVTILNTGTASGVEKFESLMNRLAERFKPQSDRASASVEGAAKEAVRLAEAINGLSAPIQAVEKSLNAAAAGDARVLTDEAARARVKATDLQAGIDSARAALARKAGPVPAPPTDDAAKLLRDQLADAAGLMTNTAANVRALATPGRLPAEAASALGRIAIDADALRDRAARQVEMLDAIDHSPLLRAARALQQNTAALVLAPPEAVKVGSQGVTAIDPDAILPLRMPAAAGAGPTPDIRFRAEDLVTAAIAALSSNTNPILVFVHTSPTPIGPAFKDFSILADRLNLRGLSVAEWPVMTQPDSPSSASLDPTGKRPIVYVALPVNGADTAEGAVRMARLSKAVGTIVDSGAPVLLTAVPSTLMSVGSKDPMVAWFPGFGVNVRSEVQLLTETPTATGRAVKPFLDAEAAASDASPVARAIRSLRTRLAWTCPIEIATSPPSGVSAWPVLNIPASERTWGEADWATFAETWGRQGPGAALPSPDSPRDLKQAGTPWIVAAAAERHVSNRTSPQRMVVVCGYGWFYDKIAALITPQAADPAIAAATLRSAGNLELFEAAAYWLAGQDELIAQSASAQAVPLMPQLSTGQVSVLRWSLVIGLPVLVLMAGATWRLLRG